MTEADTASEGFAGAAAKRLRGIVERIERLEEERRALANDIQDVFAEAKGAGFETGALREVLARRRREPAKVEEKETLVDLYCRALGM